jgi:hypothetical protein
MLSDSYAEFQSFPEQLVVDEISMFLQREGNFQTVR